MISLLRMIGARIRGFLRSSDLDRDFEEELESHLALAEEEKVRSGMSREQARRAARLELGGLTQLREAGRAARGLPWLSTLGLDLKLGLRMLRKSWGLTLVGGLAMTVAITVGVAVFTFFEIALSDSLPLDEGERVVALQVWDEKAGRPAEITFEDFERWRDRLRSLEDVGSFRTLRRNLVVDDGPGISVPVAAMSAAGFELARVPPRLGRTLKPEDEDPGAAPAVVLGFDAWRSVFSADEHVVGRTVRIGEILHTVVGVMPQGFGFPVNHGYWSPLRPAGPAPGDALRGVEVVFGRLGEGITLERAQAEVAALGLPPRTDTGSTDELLRPRIVPYVLAFDEDGEREEARWVRRLILALVALLLLPPCANIAILVYARTVARQEEFSARYVLGASRGRIVVQIFLEVLVLAAGAAGVALVVTRWATWKLDALNRDVPFWLDFSLSFEAVLFAAALAVLAALIAGALPAMRATGRRFQSGLRSLGARTGLKLGATWTALVVLQVAFSAAALPAAVELAWGTLRPSLLGPSFDAEKVLIAAVSAAPKTDPNSVQAELIRQVETGGGVTGVTQAASLPGDEPWTFIEAEGVPLPDTGIFAGDNLIRSNRVDESFFEVFELEVLTGRSFEPRDLATPRLEVVVNRTFVRKALGDLPPLGRRIRYLHPHEVAQEASGAASSEPGPWLEIIGVVADATGHETHGTVYHAIESGPSAAWLAVRMTTIPTGAAEWLRERATAADPGLRVEEIQPLAEIYRRQAVGNSVGATTLAGVTVSLLLLSAAGIYALMSFTLSQRRREIGIRAALGAQPLRLLLGVFGKSLSQLTFGAALGVLLALLVDHYLPIELVGGWSVPGVIPAAALLMVLIGLLSTAGPARRGLRIDPIEELREG